MAKNPSGGAGNTKRVRSKSGLVAPVNANAETGGTTAPARSSSSTSIPAPAAAAPPAPVAPPPVDDPLALSVDEEIQHFRGAFRSMEVKVSLENTFTRTVVSDPGAVKIIELGDRALVLEIPARTGATGHLIQITATVEGGAGGDWIFRSTAKIQELDHLEDGVDRVSVTLIQYEEESWQRLNKVFGDRQNDIEAFLAAARGY